MEQLLLDFLHSQNVHFIERSYSVTLKCPRCSKFKLDIHKSQHNYICYKCESNERIRGPRAEYILSEITNIPVQEVSRQINGIKSLSEEVVDLFDFDKPKIIQKVENETIPVEYPQGYYSIATDIAKPAVKYLEGRGIPFELTIKLKFKYSAYHKQVVFPVYHKNILVGYQGRSIDPNCPKERSKYTLPGFQKSNFVMFESSITSDSVVLAEGPISALKFAECGIGYVASMGKYVSEKQVNLLKELGVKNLYLGLDRDAKKETKAFVQKYLDVFNIYYIKVPDIREDFGACTFEECVLAYKEAQPVNLQTIEWLLND